MKNIRFDTTLALTVLLLLIFGLIMITSIGVPKSIALSAPGELYPSCSDIDVDCYLLFKKHLFRLGVGFIAFFVVLKIPLRFWKKMAPFIFGITALALMAVLIFGQSHGTIATSWVTVMNTSIQPSEFAKLSLIIYLAYWLSKKQDSIESFQDGFIPFAIMAGIIILPVMWQNDFGSTMVLGLIALAMYFAGGANIKHIGVSLVVAFLGASIVIATVPHVQERFQGFMKIGDECLEDYCWQSQQANIAVGSGGLWGKGLTQGVQKSYWLPQASDDFIFAASAEELGFLRVIFIIAAYFIIAYRGYMIASHAQTNFGMLMAIGLTTWIVFQAFINIAVNTALAPVTGITLPFVSYGGTSLVASLIAVALLLNISQHTSYHARSFNRGGHRRSRRAKLSRYRRA